MRRVRLLVVVGLLVFPSADSVLAKRKCSERQVRTLIRSFIEAYNAGDLEALDSMFTRDDFNEYRVLPLERPWPASSDRESLVAYFEERHQQGDDFRLKSLEVGPETNVEGFYFLADLERQSEDIRPWSSGQFVPQKSGTGPDCKIRRFRIQWDRP